MRDFGESLERFSIAIKVMHFRSSTSLYQLQHISYSVERQLFQTVVLAGYITSNLNMKMIRLLILKR